MMLHSRFRVAISRIFSSCFFSPFFSFLRVVIVVFILSFVAFSLLPPFWVVLCSAPSRHHLFVFFLVSTSTSSSIPFFSFSFLSPSSSSSWSFVACVFFIPCSSQCETLYNFLPSLTIPLSVSLFSCLSSSPSCQESRVRYYACETLYNIAKVARADILPAFNDVFDGLCTVRASKQYERWRNSRTDEEKRRRMQIPISKAGLVGRTIFLLFYLFWILPSLSFLSPVFILSRSFPLHPLLVVHGCRFRCVEWRSVARPSSV